MNVPMPVKLLGLVIGATLFYTWVGALVPQKEVHPPEVVELAEDVSTEELVSIGQTIYEGKGLCNTCHTIGQSGALRFPDLGGIAETAATRVPGLDQLGYLGQSIYQPNAYVVPGFNPGMPAIDKPPIALSDDEILAVIAYLQTLGGADARQLRAKAAWSPKLLQILAFPSISSSFSIPSSAARSGPRPPGAQNCSKSLVFKAFRIHFRAGARPPDPGQGRLEPKTVPNH